MEGISTMTSKLGEAIHYIKLEEYERARSLLNDVLNVDPDNLIAWLWMTQVTENKHERMIYLRQVLRINPEHKAAQRGLDHLMTQVSEPLKPRIEWVDDQPEATIEEADVPQDYPSLKEIYQEEYRRTWAQRLKTQIILSWRRFQLGWRVFAQNRLAVIGLIILIIFALMAISHPILIKTVWPKGIYDPYTGFDLEVFHPAEPSSRHILGTDNLGRDVLSMLLAATQPAFILGITVAITTATVGMFVGSVSAYFGGVVDAIFSRISDAFLLIPAPLFMVIVGVAFKEFGPAKLGAIFGIISGLGGTAITLRSYANSVLAKPFVEATRIAGGSAWQIIRRHLVPHMIPLAATLMMVAVIGAVVADAFVSFIGLTRLYLNWGTMIYTSQSYSSKVFGVVEWHVLIPPSMALSLFAASFYMISRGMQEVADPKLRKR